MQQMLTCEVTIMSILGMAMLDESLDHVQTPALSLSVMIQALGIFEEDDV